MTKIELDKYYTPLETAKYCVDKTFEIIGRENITEIIEPSAGAGSFSLQIPNCIAYDIKPDHDSIIEQDYLKLDLEYKKGRLIIGNPPFGIRCSLVKSFYKYSAKCADYIAFILPLSQLNNTNFNFDLIYSEDLGKLIYSGIPIHCCFNIYRRPDGILSKANQIRPEKLNDLKLMNVAKGKSRNDKIPEIFDYCLSSFGTIGKECKLPYEYSQQMYFIINNLLLKEKILNIIKSANWFEICMKCKINNQTTVPKLNQWQVIKYLKEQIPELK